MPRRGVRAAAALLGESSVCRPGEFDILENAVVPCRSQTEDSSSHLFKPKFQRILRAVAQHLSQRCEETLPGRAVSPDKDRLRRAFAHVGAVGGGTEEDIEKLLTRLFEGSELSKTDAGFTL